MKITLEENFETLQEIIELNRKLWSDLNLIDNIEEGHLKNKICVLFLELFIYLRDEDLDGYELLNTTMFAAIKHIVYDLKCENVCIPELVQFFRDKFATKNVKTSDEFLNNDELIDYFRDCCREYAEKQK